MILTGKFFEYLAAKRPVLCIGPTDGDAAEIIKETKCGVISDFSDFSDLKSNIICFYNAFSEGKLKMKIEGIDKYSRKFLTSRIVNILEEIRTKNEEYK